MVSDFGLSETVGERMVFALLSAKYVPEAYTSDGEKSPANSMGGAGNGGSFPVNENDRLLLIKAS